MSARGFGPIPIVFDLSPHTLGGTERFLARLLPALDARRFTPIVIARKDAAPLRFMAAQGIRTVVIGLQLLLPEGELRRASVRTAPIIHASDATAAALAGITRQIPARAALIATSISALNTALALTAAAGELRTGAAT